MNKETKIRAIIFGVIGIAVLLVIVVFAGAVSGSNAKEPANSGNLLGAVDNDFTLDDMIKINDNTRNRNSGGSILSQRHDRTYNFGGSSDNPEEEYQQADEDILLLQKTLQENREKQTPTPQQTPTWPRPAQQPDPIPQTIIHTSPEQDKTPIPADPEEPEPEPEPGRRSRETRFFRGEQTAETGNTIRAVVHGQQTITDKSTLKMRLLEDLNLENVTIPSGSYVYGSVQMTVERINVSIQSIRVGNNIYDVQRTIYDTDGLPGINMPENVRAEIIKKATAQSIQDQQINTGNTNVIDRTVSAVGTATKQVLTKFAEEAKVTLKSNHQLFLR